MVVRARTSNAEEASWINERTYRFRKSLRRDFPGLNAGHNPYRSGSLSGFSVAIQHRNCFDDSLSQSDSGRALLHARSLQFTFSLGDSCFGFVLAGNYVRAYF